MKKILFVAALLLGGLVCNAQTSDGEDFLESLGGTYVELFSPKACLSPELSSLWHDEAAKYVGEENADEAVRKLLGACQGTEVGEKAASAYERSGEFRFCCSFLAGVEKITFSGRSIRGTDCNGRVVFSHPYRFVEKDGEGSYIYESEDDNDDKFRFFWLRPDSPSETFHIEFRYGDDKEQLSQLMTGECAFWMASGVREGHKDEYKSSVILFLGENLGAKD